MPNAQSEFCECGRITSSGKKSRVIVMSATEFEPIVAPSYRL